MRSRVAVAAATAILAAMLCCAASADQWLNINFDDYSLGNINGQDGWSGAAGPVRIVADFAGSGKCVEMDCLHFGGVFGEVTRSVGSGASGIHYVEFRAAMDAELKPGQSYANLAYMKFFSTSGTELTRFYFRGDRFNLLLTGGDQHLILADASDRQWHKIGLLFNLLTGKIDVFVDDSQVVTQGGLYGSGADIGKITIGQWDQVSKYDKAECYIDSFLCSSLDPPGIGRCALEPRFFPGWQAYNVCYPCVFFDTNVGNYRMYYSGSGMGYVNDSTWDQWTTGYVTWTKYAQEGKWLFPDNYEAVLRARKFMEGDVVDPETESARFDSIFAYMPCVVQDGAAYKMWYTGWNGDFVKRTDNTANKINFRIGYATSPDGATWTKYPNNDSPAPVLDVGAGGSLDSKGVSHPWVLKKNGAYHMWYEGYDGEVWRIFHTTSANGTSWATPQMVLAPGLSGARDDRFARNPVVIDRGSTFEMWYAGESVAAPKYHVLRATSADGVSWTKIDGEITLHPANPPRRYPGQLPYDPPSPEERLLVNTVIANPDGTYTVYYAKQVSEGRSFTGVAETAKSRYFFIFWEVVDL